MCDLLVFFNQHHQHPQNKWAYQNSLILLHLDNSQSRQQHENFDSSIHSFNNVIGSATFFEGIDEIKIKPGINLKAALNFEFGSAKSASAIEVGFLGEVFPNEVIIMPTARNYSFYPTAFITLFYGRKY